MIKLKLKPSFNKTGDYDKILVDADLIAFAVSAACDGHYYAVVVDNAEVFRCRYKKDLDTFTNDLNEGSYSVIDDYEPDPWENCIHSLKSMVNMVIETCGGGEYQLYLTGKDNFRTKINPDYKANRINTRRPYHLPECRKYLVNKYGAIIANGEEADDCCGYNQTSTTIIASTDKDLDCIPGFHFNWNKQEVYEVSEEQALQNFYAQVMVGDPVDNIFGIFGVGKKGAKKIVEDSKLTSNEDLWNLVLDTYMEYQPLPCVDLDTFRDVISKLVTKVAQQIWIRRKEDEIWQPPV